jgi:hypothetical protein
MNRLRDHRPMTGRPYFLALTAGREQDPVHTSTRSQTSPPPIVDYDYTEADRQADTWRSLKATLATFAILVTVCLAFLGLVWLLFLH